MNEPFDEDEFNRRRKTRMLTTALVLGALVILFYFITIAKIGAAS